MRELFGGVWAFGAVAIYIWMMNGGIVIGTVADFLCRRCLFPFIITLIGGIIDSLPAYAYQSRVQQWQKQRIGGKNFWISGMLIVLIFELIRIRILMLHYSQWFFLLWAVSLGAFGGNLGYKLAQRWHKRSYVDKHGSKIR